MTSQWITNAVELNGDLNYYRVIHIMNTKSHFRFHFNNNEINVHFRYILGYFWRRTKLQFDTMYYNLRQNLNKNK